MGGSQKCTQGTPLVKARNGKKLKMLNLKFAWISDPAANSRQTAVATKHANNCRKSSKITKFSKNGLRFQKPKKKDFKKGQKFLTVVDW